VPGLIAWRIACGRACGAGAVCSPVALRLPGLRVGAVSGLIAWRIACGGPVVLAPFAPRWRCAYRGYGWCGVWLDRLAYCLRAGLWHWRRLLPGGAALTGATGGCGAWLERLAHRLRAGLWHWRRLFPGGAVLTGATDMVRCWGFSPGVSPVGEL
ncbi:hypothetical protein, partial [Klebsiella electrica]